MSQYLNARAANLRSHSVCIHRGKFNFSPSASCALPNEFRSCEFAHGVIVVLYVPELPVRRRRAPESLPCASPLGWVHFNTAYGHASHVFLGYEGSEFRSLRHWGAFIAVPPAFQGLPRRLGIPGIRVMV